MQKKTTKPQTRPPVDREAIRILAIELGAREAARRAGVNENTILSWSRRYKWDLPQRTGGPKAIELQSKPGDVLIATHKELEAGTRTALMQTLHKAAQAVARKDPLDISNMGQFRDACLSAARMFGWDGNAQPSVNYYGDDNRTVVVCDPERRKQLQEQRQRLLEQEATQASEHKVEAAVPVTLPEQSNANVGEGKSIVTQDQSAVAPKDPLTLWRESVGKAETWK